MTGRASARIVLGCVADNNHKYLSQALRLVRSVRWFGGTLKDVDIVVCVVHGVESNYRRAFESLGATIRIVGSFDPANPLFNKIQVFRLPDVERYDTLLYLDCDTIVAQDPSSFLDSAALRIKVADVPTVSTEALEQLCDQFGIDRPERRYRTTLDQTPTVWYCNAGVVSIPVAFIPQVVPRWCEFELKFSANPELLGPNQRHRRQAALALAFMSNPVPFEELPVSMNFPLHLTHLEPPPEMVSADPVILHYHDRVNVEGYLLPAPYPLAQKRIEAFNEALREIEPDQRIDVAAAPAKKIENGRPPVDAEPVVVCVAGMHRSGTSMIARLLHSCGVDVGPESELALAAEDNEEGFWENAEFVDLNNELLRVLGGTWDAPPAQPESWDGARIDELRHLALDLINRQNDKKHWGWKDPRNSLTLPFWKQLVPRLKVVICLRNPIEVAESLAKRGSVIDARRLELWQVYNRRLMAAVPPEDRVVTHYSVYFDDPRKELRRVLSLLGIHVSDEAVERAAATVSSSLRHHQVTTRELVQAGLPDEIVIDYLAMCSEGVLETRDGDSEWLRRELKAREADLAALNGVLAVRDRDLAWLKNELELVQSEEAALRAVVEVRDRDLAWLKNQLAMRDRELAPFRLILRLRSRFNAVKRRFMNRKPATQTSLE